MSKSKMIMEKSNPFIKLLFLHKCKKLIDKYENSSVFGGRISSKSLLIDIIKSSSTYKYFLLGLNPNEIDLRCHLLLEDIIWHELHMKQYYLPDGGIDLYNYGASMRGVHDECLIWLLRNKHISQKDFDKKVYERDCELIFLNKCNMRKA